MLPVLSLFAGNYDTSAVAVRIGPHEAFFSHGQCIAFRAGGCDLVVLELPESEKTKRRHASRLRGRLVDAETFKALFEAHVATDHVQDSG